MDVEKSTTDTNISIKRLKDASEILCDIISEIIEK